MLGVEGLATVMVTNDAESATHRPGSRERCSHNTLTA
jgi:hypothetical protein